MSVVQKVVLVNHFYFITVLFPNGNIPYWSVCYLAWVFLSEIFTYIKAMVT
jgi:hypothetical protein